MKIKMQRTHNMLSYLRMPSLAGSMSSASSNGCRHPVPAKQRCNFIHQRIADPMLSILHNSTYMPDTAQWNVGIWGHLSPIMQSRCCIRTGRVSTILTWDEPSGGTHGSCFSAIMHSKNFLQTIKKNKRCCCCNGRLCITLSHLECLFMHQLNGVCFFLPFVSTRNTTWLGIIAKLYVLAVLSLQGASVQGACTTAHTIL